MRLAAISLVLVVHGAAHAGAGIGGSLHAGVAAAENTVVGDDDPGPQSGLGWMIDGDAGLRLNDLISVHVAVAYASLHENAQWSNYLDHNVGQYRDLSKYGDVITARLAIGARL